jgi:YD repeat-containing protein
MNKLKTLLLLTLSLTIMNCSSDDENNDSDPNVSLNLVKSIDDGFKINYTYSNGLLTNASGSDNSNSLEINYTYDSNNRVIGMSSSETSGSDSFDFIVNYSYDSNGRITSSTSQGQTTTYDYSGNTVSIDSNANSGIQLELDSNGKVRRLNSTNFYKIFTYDNNGNLVLNEEFDNNDMLTKKYEYSYDQNLNPFFNQLESIYLEKFIGFFAGSGSSFTDSFYFDFPYLKNNLVSNSFNDGTPDTYVFDLNSDGFPITISETQSDGFTNNYTIEY